MAYTDGEIRQAYEVTVIGLPVGGEPTINEEADGVRWILPSELDAYDIHPSMRKQIAHFLDGTYPHVDRAPRASLPSDRSESDFDPVHCPAQLGFRSADEPPDDAVLAVPTQDLRQAGIDRGRLTVRCRRHVAVSQGVHQRSMIGKGKFSFKFPLSPRSSASSTAHEWLATNRTSLSSATV